jgi:hypothetical protein
VLPSRSVPYRVGRPGGCSRCTAPTTFTGMSTMRTSHPSAHLAPWKIVFVFAAIYLILGSTYLAILFSIETLPPFSMAAVRFTVAGGILYSHRSPADGSAHRAQLGFGWYRGHTLARRRQRWRCLGRIMGSVRPCRTDRRHCRALDGSLRLAVRRGAPPERTPDAWSGAVDELDRG